MRPLVLALMLVSTAACTHRDTDVFWQAPQRGWLLVTDETRGYLVLVDPRKGAVVGRVSVGKRPRGLRLSHDRQHVLVALSGSPIGGPGVDESSLPPADRQADGIGEIALVSGKLLRTLPSGVDPETFDLSGDGGAIYAANEDAAEMSAIDLQSGSVRRVRIGAEPEGVTTHPNGRLVYVTCEGDNSVYAIDAAALSVQAKIPTAARPRAVVFTPDGTTGFVSAENAAALTVFDAGTNTVTATIALPAIPGAPTDPRPMGMAMTRDGRHLLVSLGRARAIAEIDVASRRVIRTMTDVGDRPWGIALDDGAIQAFTANGPSSDVTVIDLSAGLVSNRITVGGSPWGVVVVP